MYPYEVIQELEEQDFIIRDVRDGAMVAGPYTSQVAATLEAQRLYHILRGVENPTGRGPRGAGGVQTGIVGGAQGGGGESGGAQGGAGGDHGWTLHGGAYRG